MKQNTGPPASKKVTQHEKNGWHHPDKCREGTLQEGKEEDESLEKRERLFEQALFLC